MIRPFTGQGESRGPQLRRKPGEARPRIDRTKAEAAGGAPLTGELALGHRRRRLAPEISCRRRPRAGVHLRSVAVHEACQVNAAGQGGAAVPYPVRGFRPGPVGRPGGNGLTRCGLTPRSAAFGYSKRSRPGPGLCGSVWVGVAVSVLRPVHQFGSLDDVPLGVVELVAGTDRLTGSRGVPGALSRGAGRDPGGARRG